MEIEDIQQLGWKEGTEDLELRAEISSLQVGDPVKLTFRLNKASFAGETLLMITNIRHSAFRGKLAAKPVLIGLSKLRVGSLVRFRAAHIHSIAKR